jgi:rhodanese-related sulfurtransferase
LEEVANKHDITDLDSILQFIQEADQLDRRIQVSPAEVSAAMKSPAPPRLLDVRTPAEWQLANIQGATLMTQDLAREMMSWPKDTPVVFYCHNGQRSMDAASYFAGHGFSNTRSMNGGIEAWSHSVDPSVPRYEVARDPSTGRGMLRPLRSVVSQDEGCLTPKPGR